MYRVGKNLIIFEQERKLVAKLTDAKQVAVLKGLPNVESLTADDQTLVSLPWTEDACRLLANIGINTVGAAPLWLDERLPLVEGKYSPMPHQLFTAAFITLNPRCYVLNDPRTGKTGALTIAFDYLQRQRFVSGAVLIITTVTTIPYVWADSIRDALPRATVVELNGKTRESGLQKPADFYVTNYDSCRLSCGAFLHAVREGRIGAVVIDELTHVGSVSSDRHKSINRIINDEKKPVEYVVGATGSPGDNYKTTFGMCSIINKGKLPCGSQTAWRELLTYKYGLEHFQRRLRKEGPEIIFNTMQPAVRFAKSDVITSLPPVAVQTLSAGLSSEQAKLLRELRADAVAKLQSGELITAVNGGILYHKMQQVAQGVILGDDGRPIYLDNKPRMDVILEVIRETSRKIVISCFYTATIERLKDDLEKAKYTVGVVNGAVKGRARAAVLKAFAEETDPHILLIHPTTVAYGTELAAADTMIINGPPRLGEAIWAQLLERLSSAKQKADKINIIRISSTPEEQRHYKVLDNGRNLGLFINALFEDYVKGVL